MIDCSRSRSIVSRNGRPGATSSSCPTISSSDRGRMRSASGMVLRIDGRRWIVEQAHVERPAWPEPCQGRARVRCRCASYNNTAAATAAFNDSMPPAHRNGDARVGARDQIIRQPRTFAAQQQRGWRREIDVVHRRAVARHRRHDPQAGGAPLVDQACQSRGCAAPAHETRCPSRREALSIPTDPPTLHQGLRRWLRLPPRTE